MYRHELHVHVFALFVLRVTCRERGGYINLVEYSLVLVYCHKILEMWKNISLLVNHGITVHVL